MNVLCDDVVKEELEASMAQDGTVANPCPSCDNMQEAQFQYLAINPPDLVRECDVCGYQSPCDIQDLGEEEWKSKLKIEAVCDKVEENGAKIHEIEPNDSLTNMESIRILAEQPIVSSSSELLVQSTTDGTDKSSSDCPANLPFDIHLQEIETLENLIFSQPCRKCNANDEESFKRFRLHPKDLCHYRQCLHCYDLVGLDDSVDTEQFLTQLRNGEYKFCDCGNSSINALIIATEIDSIICEICGVVISNWSASNHNSFLADAVAENVPATNTSILAELPAVDPQNEASRPTIEGRTKITNFHDLRKGDHVMMERVNVTGYWHHAIVFDVISKERMTLIHFSPVEKETLDSIGLTSPEDLNKKSQVKVIIQEIDRGFTGDSLYRVDYAKEEHVFSVDVVIDRAWQYIMKDGYNLVLGNCEHFARWCKTNKWMSKQVIDFFGQIGGLLRTNIFGGGQVGRLLAGAAKGLMKNRLSAVVNVSDDVIVKAANLKCVGPILGAAAVAVCVTSGLEIYATYKDIKKEEQKLKLKVPAITPEEFEISKQGRIRNCAVTCAVNASITMGITTASLLLTFVPVVGPVLAISVPVLGSIAGVVLGKALGRRVESRALIG